MERKIFVPSGTFVLLDHQLALCAQVANIKTWRNKLIVRYALQDIFATTHLEFLIVLLHFAQLVTLVHLGQGTH